MRKIVASFVILLACVFLSYGSAQAQIVDKVKDAADKTKEVTKDVADKTKDVTVDTAKKTGVVVTDGLEKAGDKTEKAAKINRISLPSQARFLNFRLNIGSPATISRQRTGMLR